MKITLAFHGGLKKYQGDVSEAMMELPEGTLVIDLLARLQIPREEIAFVAVNGSRVPWSQPLADGDEVKLFQPVGGG